MLSAVRLPGPMRGEPTMSSEAGQQKSGVSQAPRQRSELPDFSPAAAPSASSEARIALDLLLPLFFHQGKKRGAAKPVSRQRGAAAVKRENPQDPPLCRQVSITATAIEGRLTALLIYQDAIKLSVGGINQTLVAGVAILTEIRDNTSHCQRLEQIESGIGSMKRELETINSRGVTLRTA